LKWDLNSFVIEHPRAGAPPQGSQASETRPRLQQQPTIESDINAAVKNRSSFIRKSYPNPCQIVVQNLVPSIIGDTLGGL